MELAEDKLLSRAVITDHSSVVVDFSTAVFRLRQIRRSVFHFQEAIIQDELVGSARDAVSRLSQLVALPRADEKTQGREGVRPGPLGAQRRRGCSEQNNYCAAAHHYERL
jgi:hypothetical protein